MCGNWGYLGAGKEAILKTILRKNKWREIDLKGKHYMVWFGLDEAY